MEGTSQLDLESLKSDYKPSILIPFNRKLPLTKQNDKLILIISISISSLILLIRMIITPKTFIYSSIIIILLLTAYYRKFSIKDNYKIDKDGIIIPYLWFLTKKIKFREIVIIKETTLIEKSTSKEYKSVIIHLDTKLSKFNITGLDYPQIILTSKNYDPYDLEQFANLLKEKNDENNSPPNTLAQRTVDQVNRSWNGRWLNIFIRVFDSTTEFIFYLFMLEGVAIGLFNNSIWIYSGLIIVFFYMLIIFLIQYLDRPSAIISIRPHELGPLIYNEADVVTSIRFIMMSRPKSVNIVQCELIYSENNSAQITKFKQVEPKHIESNKLEYIVAQFIGNHTKSSGIKVLFNYDNNDELQYEVSIFW